MSEVAFAIQPVFSPVVESSFLATMQPTAGVNCLWCGREFPKPILGRRGSNKKFCKSTCRTSFCRVKYPEKYSKKLPRKHINCINCGNKIHSKKVSTAKFCSYVCSNRNNAKRNSKSPSTKQKIRRAMAHRMRTALRHAGGRKTKSTFDLLGCDSQKAKDWIESKFLPSMCWENWGEVWHVDHIKPCASFNLLDESEQKKCFHYTNLQPLWWIDNIQKGNRLDWSPAGL